VRHLILRSEESLPYRGVGEDSLAAGRGGVPGCVHGAGALTAEPGRRVTDGIFSGRIASMSEVARKDAAAP
jgi:hypothetical protein